jgi:hypothetical protein
MFGGRFRSEAQDADRSKSGLLPGTEIVNSILRDKGIKITEQAACRLADNPAAAHGMLVLAAMAVRAYGRELLRSIMADDMKGKIDAAFKFLDDANDDVTKLCESAKHN